MTDVVSSQAVPTKPATFDYASLAANATDTVEGYDLTRDKDVLLGVPFVITGVTYRDGTPRLVPGEVMKAKTNYLSIEVVTANRELLQQRVKRGAIEDLRVEPNETLIINDGSTGIARQVTEFLHLKGIIDVGDYETTGGAAGESPFDRYRTDWVRGAEAAEAGIKAYPLLLCPRGLRVSEYTADGQAGESKTYYLA